MTGDKDSQKCNHSGRKFRVIVQGAILYSVYPSVGDRRVEDQYMC